MSNVLIGIIGVILFIGLALAGALFLGPRFQEATSNSQAAAMMTQLKQVSDAVDMWKLNTGNGYVPVTGTTFLQPGYLKTTPRNPVSGSGDGYFWSPRFDNNIYPVYSDEPIYAGKWVIAPIGRGVNTQASRICDSINRTYGQVTTQDDTGGDPRPAGMAGCILARGDDGTGVTDWYVAYQRIAPLDQNLRMGSSGALQP